MRAQPQALPGMETLTTWMNDWLGIHHPEESAQPEWEACRKEMLEQLPFGFVPSIDRLVQRWWAREYQNRMVDLGYRRFQPTPSEPVLAAVELQLPLQGMLSLIAGDLARARQDIQSAKERLARWIKAHDDLALDLDSLFQGCLAAAGLAA